MKHCKWHRCNKRFDPITPRQVFCGDRCRRLRLMWKRNKAASIVDLLLDNDAEGLIALQRKLRKDIFDETPRH